MKRYHILLGSGSPRRRELMSVIAPDYTAISIKDVEETYPESLAAHDVPKYLSQLKASAYRDELKSGEILVTADTVVILDDAILGKPADREEAIAMLRSLSGRTHDVVTGVTLTTIDKTYSFSSLTSVTFAELDDNDIIDYVDRFKPFDKAGSYGVQERIGMIGITSIDGSFYNVMGLPTAALCRAMRQEFDCIV